MIKVVAQNEETKNLLSFYVSNNIPDLQSFMDCLNYIRYGYPRNWRRIDHTPISSHPDTNPPRAQMKYIVLRDEKNEHEYMVVFDTSINHDYMELAVSSMQDDVFYRPASAGFTDGLTCFGRSETLNLDSRPEEDTKLLQGG